MALRQTASIVSDDEREVTVDDGGKVQGRLHDPLACGGEEEVGSAEDVRYAVLRVVEDHGELIAGLEASVGRYAGDDEVAAFGRKSEVPWALDEVVDRDVDVRHAEAKGKRLSEACAFRDRVDVETRAGPGINEVERRVVRSALGVDDVAARAATGVDESGFEEMKERARVG